MLLRVVETKGENDTEHWCRCGAKPSARRANERCSPRGARPDAPRWRREKRLIAAGCRAATRFRVRNEQEDLRTGPQRTTPRVPESTRPGSGSSLARPRKRRPYPNWFAARRDKGSFRNLRHRSQGLHPRPVNDVPANFAREHPRVRLDAGSSGSEASPSARESPACRSPVRLARRHCSAWGTTAAKTSSGRPGESDT